MFQISLPRMIATIGTVMFATVAAAATSADEAVLHPSSPWKVDYAKEECRLVRTFGTGQDSVTLRLARGSGMQSFDMVIAGENFPPLSGEVKVTMRLEPQGAEDRFDGYSMHVPERPERFVRWYDGNPAILDSITNTQRVRLTTDKGLNIAMLWSGGKAALAALQTCHDDLLREWGVDVDAFRALKVPPEPVGSPGRWATNDDYPVEQLQREQEGIVTFQLKVSPTGTVENCIVLLSSDIAAFDHLSCKLMMERAKFKPALDANNQPTTSFYVNRIRWQIPR